MTSKDAPVIIKKYSNRRLYDTQTSSYITLDDVRELVTKGVEFEVRDAKSNEDLTRQILAQIIFEQELNGKQQMLPINFLKRMISMYDDKISDVFPYYLDGTMEAFMANQEKIQDQIRELWGQYNPVEQMEALQRKNVEQMEAMQRKNMELMHNAMQMFNPFEYLKTPDQGKE